MTGIHVGHIILTNYGPISSFFLMLCVVFSTESANTNISSIVWFDYRSTWVHPRFLVGFVLLDLYFICMFCRSLFVLLYFFFWSLCVCSSSIYGFWLPLWYLQTLIDQRSNQRSSILEATNLTIKTNESMCLDRTFFKQDLMTLSLLTEIRFFNNVRYFVIAPFP